MTRGIDHLIVNSPFEEPARHWAYEREAQRFVLRDGRRPAGYVRATPGVDTFDDPGIFVALPLPNQIRPRVREWRLAGYPGVTSTTKRLLAHWTDPEGFADRRFFFCQLEAVETLIWLTEASPAERQGIAVPSDGGAFPRLCAKMATGSGKTIVMALAIAWHILNKVAEPRDRRFSKHVLVVAPGLTVRNRLRVLEPAGEDNFYDKFDVVPGALRDQLRQGQVVIRNWHVLAWESAERLAKKRSVDKRGPRSDEAYVREVLQELASARNLLVINDEAHHAWRLPAEADAGTTKAEQEEATVWVGGLDRIQRARGILGAYDFSATPFVPSGKRSAEEALFGWVVNDFGLSDAIESGLVKTPRVVVRDDGVPDAKSYRSKLFHIYPHVSEDLNRKAGEHEPLPQLVANAYYLLGRDWLEAADEWKQAGAPTPPVMITVANRTETAARIRYAFEHKRMFGLDELCDRERLLHIDSKVLEAAEACEDDANAQRAEVSEDEEDGARPTPKRLTKDQEAERLRRMVDTVGQPGKPGAQIQNVISVGMLSEGWDARTVTHIMGLRAFTSQLLCEQVVGRGLRRTSYELNAQGLFDPEFVNVFGVPFTFLPHEEQDGPPPPPPPPRTRIEPLPDRQALGIDWPNVLRVDQTYRPRLTLDLESLPLLRLDALDVRQVAELAPTVDGKPDWTRIKEVDLEEIGRRSRLQTLAFRAAAEVFDQMKPGWSGGRDALLGQVVRLVDRFLESDRIAIDPPLFGQDTQRRRILLALSMPRIVQHLFSAIRHQNVGARTLVLDREHPIRGTGDMTPWYTARPCAPTTRSHVNFCVFDSTWEATEAFSLDHDAHVDAWVKNDHLGFDVHYIFQGAVRRYRPDFLIRLTNGVRLILEVKGQDADQHRAKRAALAEWVDAVNDHGGFGTWRSDVSFWPSDIGPLLARHGSGGREAEAALST